jgi:hypothetical protein
MTTQSTSKAIAGRYRALRSGAVPHHLAQLNVARALDALDSERLAGFIAEIEPVNALADAAPGFLWRLQDEDGDAPGATGVRAYDDPWMIVNLSVWETADALWDFVYAGRHLDVMRRRREWFTRIAEAHQVLWWVPAGTIPTVEDARARLERLRTHGPTPDAFTFKARYAAPA